MAGLFDPLPLACGLTVRNRVFQAPMSVWMADNQRPSQRMADFYAERARGGVGLIVAEAQPVHPTSEAHPWIRGWDRDNIAGLRVIADAVHQHGALLFNQLIHNGRLMTGARSRLPIWAPSAIPNAVDREVPHAMTRDEIGEVVRAFGDSAAILQEAGYDGVELHAAHGYLFQQFLLEATNQRQDEYGGSFENRLRFFVEVGAEIRRRCGARFGLGIQINASEGLPGGTSPELAAAVAQHLEASSWFDYLGLSVGSYAGGDPAVSQSPDMSFPHAPYAGWSRQLRLAVRALPIGTIGRVREPAATARLIEDGMADYVALARPLLTDPFWVAKAQRGDFDAIRPCIGVNQECRQGATHLVPGCIHNPTLGAEAEWGEGRWGPSATRRRVLVIGGGPAGLEAATWAARRGHVVTLREATGQLGGVARLAAQPPHRLGFTELVDYQLRQVAATGVIVELDAPVALDADLAAFDAVIVATGSRLVPPALPGDGSVPLTDLWSVLADPSLVAGRVAVVEPGLAGWDVGSAAQLLAHRGCSVIAIGGGSSWCPSVPGPDASRFAQLNRDLGIEVLTGVGRLSVAGGELAGWRSNGDSWRSGPLMAAVMYQGQLADDALLHALQRRHPLVIGAGDCIAPRRASQAIREGFLAAVSL